MEEPKTHTIDEAAKELGIGRNQAYAAARRGELPTIQIGKRIRGWSAHKPGRG